MLLEAATLDFAKQFRGFAALLLGFIDEVTGNQMTGIFAATVSGDGS